MEEDSHAEVLFEGRYNKNPLIIEGIFVSEELADGGLLLRLRTGGLGEVQRWVMQYVGHAEVLEPEELREALEKEAKKMAEVYQEAQGARR